MKWSKTEEKELIRLVEIDWNHCFPGWTQIAINFNKFGYITRSKKSLQQKYYKMRNN